VKINLGRGDKMLEKLKLISFKVTFTRKITTRSEAYKLSLIQSPKLYCNVLMLLYRSIEDVMTLTLGCMSRV